MASVDEAGTHPARCGNLSLQGGEDVKLADIAAYCRARGLAVYKTPERLEVVDGLPRNAMGKVIKKRLRESVTGAGASAPTGVS